MISIVVYGDNNAIIRKCVDSVNASLFNCGINYHIDIYEKYTKEMELIIRNDSKKIYILNEESKISGLEIASKIREYDYDSIIIMIGNGNNDLFSNRMMFLDYICFDDIYEDRLIDDIRMAVSIIDKHIIEKSILDNNIDEDIGDIEKNKDFVFKYKRVVYRIPFCDITYIEKESNIKRCIIHTINNKYYITDSLNSIYSKLDGDFCRSHQSCIINLNNIKKIELGNNMIIFNNDDSVDMITCKTKKEIKKYIGVS